MEETVIFENENGGKFFGIVHVPEPEPVGMKRVGVNLLNPGIKYRVAPNRLNVKIARALCNKGYYVFRFDPAGIGDSEGDLPENVLVTDIWEKIQTGLFVSDTICSNNYFHDNYNIEKLIMAGSCGGAITSLLAGARDSRIDALVLIDVPVNLRTSNMSFADKVVDGGQKADWLFYEYLKRLLSIKAWFRFLTFKSDFSALRKTTQMKLRKILTSFQPFDNLPSEVDELCRQKKLNSLFFKSFETVVDKEKPILFVLAGNDSGAEIFKHFFLNGYIKKKQDPGVYEKLFDVFLIENANHVYTLYESQQLLIGKICDWVESKF